jgi:hypothetical protein
MNCGTASAALTMFFTSYVRFPRVTGFIYSAPRVTTRRRCSHRFTGSVPPIPRGILNENVVGGTVVLLTQFLKSTTLSPSLGIIAI